MPPLGFGVIPFAPDDGATLGLDAVLSGAREKPLNLESYSVTFEAAAGNLIFVMVTV